VLLIHGAIVADAMLPPAREPALADRYRVIRYRRRGHGASDPPAGGFSPTGQALDAAALLKGLGVERAHVVGHSGGGAIAVQVAIDVREVVHSLVVLEPATIPAELRSASPQMAAPVIEAYQAGDVRRAIDLWMGLVDCGPDWQSRVEQRVPGATRQAEQDARFFFGEELPRLSGLAFDREQCSRIRQPALCLVGGASGPMIDVMKQHFLSLVPHAEKDVVPGVNHLMQMGDPKAVAAAIADFLARHPL
jgi:pimeloyl-ACP methyl ester carboxylesterase